MSLTTPGKSSDGLPHHAVSSSYEERRNVLFPQRDSCPHLVHVLKPVVDRGDAGDRAGGMVQKPLDDIRGDAERGEVRGECATQIVEGPRLDPGAGVKGRFALTESVERRGLSAGGEEEPGCGRHALEEFGSNGTVGDRVFAPVLRERCGKSDDPLLRINPLAAKGGDLAAALTGDK